MRRSYYVGILATAVIVLTVNLASATASASQANRNWLRTSTKSLPSGGQASGYSYGKWALVLLTASVGGWALWKRRRSAAVTTAPAITKMKVTAVTRISTKGQIVALEVQGRTLLVGATDTQITRLGWLDDDGTSAEAIEDDYPEAAEAPVTRGGPLPPSRSAGHWTSLKATSAKPSQAHPTAPAKSSRFRELLADAIGLQPKAKGSDTVAVPAPVDELVLGAQDRYIPSGSRLSRPQRARAETAHAATLIDVEGQAQGLVARLSRPST